MSIKAKLSCSISIIVAIILMLNIMFAHINARHAQEEGLEQWLRTIAKQLAVTIENLESTRENMETELGERLRVAAIMVQERLGPDVANITNEQLVSLRQELGLNDITLWQRIDGKNVTVRSSNPDEMNMSSETWDYWDDAFHQLFDLQRVTVSEGMAREHYWTGPINFAASNPDQINKWGYYYDGNANYMTNTIIDTSSVQYDLVNSTNAIIDKILSLQPALLEITGFSPEFFGKKRIIKMKKGIPVYNLDVRDIPFGTYDYANTDEDSVHIQDALRSGEVKTVEFSHNKTNVRRSFIPVQAEKPYVIGIAFDESVLREPLRKQLVSHIVISVGLVLLTMAVSYFIAGYMMRSLNQIIYKVNAIAAGRFRDSISIRNKDELGLLAARVNTMGSNLHQYTTQLKETAQELQSTKQYLESFVGHTSDAIHVVDLQGNMTQVNKAFETMFGWTSEEVLGGPLPNIPEEQLDAHRELMEKVMRGDSVTDYETVRYTKDGAAIDVSMTVSVIRDERGEVVAVASISRNITSRKQAEEMLRRSEKLSVVGQLAAGVAHEVRNPLTTIRGFVQLHKKTGRLSEENLELMLAELDQINMIVSEFLVLAKPQANRYERFRLDELVKDIMLLLDSEAKRNNVRLTLLAAADMPDMSGVSNQLKQVFVNVMKNGIEAMPEGGELTIQIAVENEREAVVRFTDQGGGIAEADLERLGEPFFSRKEGGNGLGLMVSQQIIANHQGGMSFSSTVGEGTCVEIRLPTDGGARDGQHDAGGA